MKFCQKCGKELVDEAVVCINCGCAVGNIKVPKQVANDEISVGLCILAVLIPLFGFIYWPLKHQETPKKAQACGLYAITAWVIYMAVFSVFLYI